MWNWERKIIIEIRNKNIILYNENEKNFCLNLKSSWLRKIIILGIIIRITFKFYYKKN